MSEFKAPHHGIILTKERVDEKTSTLPAYGLQHLAGQCCGFVESAWERHDLTFIYPVDYLKDRTKDPDKFIKDWIEFLKPTPFNTIEYKGIKNIKDIAAERTIPLLKSHLADFLKAKEEFVPKFNYTDYFVFKINLPKIIVPRRKSLVVFSMIRTIFAYCYSGYVEKCLAIKAKYPDAHNFYILQMAIMGYENFPIYCQGGYHLLSINNAKISFWKWKLTSADQFVKDFKTRINPAFIRNNEYEFSDRKSTYEVAVLGWKIKPSETEEFRTKLKNYASKENYPKWLELAKKTE